MDDADSSDADRSDTAYKLNQVYQKNRRHSLRLS